MEVRGYLALAIEVGGRHAPPRGVALTRVLVLGVGQLVRVRVWVRDYTLEVRVGGQGSGVRA